jgi:hypothetical protein
MDELTRKRAFAGCAVVLGAVVAILSLLPSSDGADPAQRAPITPRGMAAKTVIGGPATSSGSAGPRRVAPLRPTAVARRFASAYLRYQAGLADEGTWRVLGTTGAPALVASLQSTRIAPPTAGGRVPRGRVTGVTVADRTASSVTVIVRTRNPGGPGHGQQSIELTLEPKGAEWHVTGMG